MSLFCNDIWVLFKTSVFLKMTSFCFRCLCAPNFYGIHCKDRSNDCASGTNQELCGHGVCVNHDRNGFTCICEQVSDIWTLISVNLFDFQLHVIYFGTSLFLVNILPRLNFCRTLVLINSKSIRCNFHDLHGLHVFNT